MAWVKLVIEKMQASSLFSEVNLVGAKVRASIDETRFADIHFDPSTQSYSYGPVKI